MEATLITLGIIIAAGVTAEVVNSIDISTASTYDSTIEGIQTGKPWRDQTVYRVFGGSSPLYGRSCTPVGPANILDFADKSGIPTWNSEQYVAIGIITNPAGIIARPSLPFEQDGKTIRLGGKLWEYYVPEPLLVEDHITVLCVFSILGMTDDGRYIF